MHKLNIIVFICLAFNKYFMLVCSFLFQTYADSPKNILCLKLYKMINRSRLFRNNFIRKCALENLHSNIFKG